MTNCSSLPLVWEGKWRIWTPIQFMLTSSYIKVLATTPHLLPHIHTHAHTRAHKGLSSIRKIGFSSNYSFDSLVVHKVWCHWSVPCGVHASNWNSRPWWCVPMGLQLPVLIHARAHTHTYTLMCNLVWGQRPVSLTAELMHVTLQTLTSHPSLKRRGRDVESVARLSSTFMKRHNFSNLTDRTSRLCEWVL